MQRFYTRETYTQLSLGSGRRVMNHALSPARGLQPRAAGEAVAGRGSQQQKPDRKGNTVLHYAAGTDLCGNTNTTIIVKGRVITIMIKDQLHIARPGRRCRGSVCLQQIIRLFFGVMREM